MMLGLLGDFRHLNIIASMKRYLSILVFLVLSGHVVGVTELEGLTDEYEDTEVVIEGELTTQESDWSESVPPTKEAKKELSPLWDEDEFEGFESESQPIGKESVRTESTGGGKPYGPVNRRKKSIFKKQESYKWEVFGLVVLLVYLANIYWGKLQNEAIALAWAKTFVSEGSLLAMNFSMLGGVDQDKEVLLKESCAEFKFYASGRRYCQGMLITLNLRSRQDLLAWLFHLISPQPDTLDVDVYMNEMDMGPMVCLLTSPKLAKGFIRENQDVEIYAREIPVKQIPRWPMERVSVWTESSDLFYDLMVPEVKNLFLSEEFEQVYWKLFRFLYITSDYSKGTNKKVIKFSFNFPPVHKMEELEKLMSLVPLMIDLVAEYEPSMDAKKRAEKNRAMESERVWREGAEERREAFQQKKAEQHQAELERVRRMSPEDQQKWKEKQERIKQKRATKVRTLRA
eukprot:g9064.t1